MFTEPFRQVTKSPFPDFPSAGMLGAAKDIKIVPCGWDVPFSTIPVVLSAVESLVDGPWGSTVAEEGGRARPMIVSWGSNTLR